jgi:hypothetical protein
MVVPFVLSYILCTYRPRPLGEQTVINLQKVLKFPSLEHEFYVGIKSTHCADPDRIGYFAMLEFGVGEFQVVIHQNMTDEGFDLMHSEVAARTGGIVPNQSCSQSVSRPFKRRECLSSHQMCRPYPNAM